MFVEKETLVKGCGGPRLGSIIAVMACIGACGWAGQAYAQEAGRKQLTTLVKKKVGRVKDLQINPFFGDFSGDGQNDALVIVYYANRGGGNSFEIEVMLYEGSAAGFRYLRNVQNIYGGSPRAARFKQGQVKITLTTLGPDDPRCCPSVAKEYVIAAP